MKKDDYTISASPRRLTAKVREQRVGQRHGAQCGNGRHDHWPRHRPHPHDRPIHLLRLLFSLVVVLRQDLLALRRVALLQLHQMLLQLSVHGAEGVLAAAAQVQEHGQEDVRAGLVRHRRRPHHSLVRYTATRRRHQIAVRLIHHRLAVHVNDQSAERHHSKHMRERSNLKSHMNQAAMCQNRLCLANSKR